ncbi:Fur-regulated basic protein FbpA [Sporosarcina aquimarina]|uniref:Fur-regulated basic protein FbpA n=1 Tax=Sporosarcina aquimarina TaxID=114975 RepID=UPI001C8DEB70|nr:Fur-regulated basic protein FbpA [Sporosarcina aquimarina]MBY0223223.1 Fur-regulated basic protein FbpA [Sporosarcina aquimarina]
MKRNENIVETKRDELIDELVSNGVFKIDGKQLYELSLRSLMQEYEAVDQPETQL